MRHRYPWLIAITILIVLASAYACYFEFQAGQLPFSVTVANAHTAVVEPIAGIPLPPGMRSGDQIDLPVSSHLARVALLPDILDTAVLAGEGQTYDFMLRKDSGLVPVPVVSVRSTASTGEQLAVWLNVFDIVLYAAVSLLLLWRGRDQTSASMLLWVLAMWIGYSSFSIPAVGNALLAVQLEQIVFFSLARVGFYLTIEFMLGAVLSLGRRRLFRGIFLLVLLAGVAQQLGGTLMFVTSGWAELLRPAYGLVFSASYLVPVIMLFMSYGVAGTAQRLRLRWILWSSVIWVAGIVLSNTPLLGFIASNVTMNIMFLIGFAGFLYMVLRHRVVDVSVAIDRTLVYGGVTALVVGILAALNSVIQHAALGTSASLLLQIVVPLALGIVLGQVRNYAEKIVEQIFFRKRYLAEQALRRFARHSAHYERAEQLFDASIAEIRAHVGARGVAIYERKQQGYIVVRQAGEIGYPGQAAADDAAFVAARSGAKWLDLSEIHSQLGTDGYIFPMMAQGALQAVLVCANRPGEHYAADERTLLAYVARRLGAALYGLRMRINLQFVEALSTGSMSASDEVRSQARKLVSIDAPC